MQVEPSEWNFWHGAELCLAGFSGRVGHKFVKIFRANFWPAYKTII